MAVTTPPYNVYIVSGTTDPDCTGVYWQSGTWNGKPYYKHQSKNFYISVPNTGGSQWYIAAEKAVSLTTNNYWDRFTNIAGIYGAGGAVYTGTPTVTVIKIQAVRTDWSF
jgi:hypothetical protein